MSDIDWLERIKEKFGKNYVYLSLGYIPISEEGYSILEKEIEGKSSSEYDIYIRDYTFRLTILDDIITGIALAVYAAELPIRIVEVRGDELDLRMIAQEKIYLSSDDITSETIDEYSWDFMGVTCILNTSTGEEILVTTETAFTIYGIKAAFDWIKRRFKDKAPSIEKYIKEIYFSDESEFSPITLDTCLGYE